MKPSRDRAMVEAIRSGDPTHGMWANVEMAREMRRITGHDRWNISRYDVLPSAGEDAVYASRRR